MIDPYVASVGAEQTSSAVCSSLRLGMNRHFLSQSNRNYLFPSQQQTRLETSGRDGELPAAETGCAGS